MDKLKAISSKFRRLKGKVKKDEDYEKFEEELMKLLTATCAVIEQGSGNASMEKTADDLINQILSFSHGEDIEIDFLPSFAHCKGLVIKDPASKGLGSLGNHRQLTCSAPLTIGYIS